MSHGLYHNHPPEPAVHEIECVEWGSKKRNERIISPSSNHQRNQINDSQSPRRFGQSMQRCSESVGPFDRDHTKDNIQCNIAKNQECFEPGGYRPHMGASLANAKLAVVSSLKKWGVDQVLVQFGFDIAWLTERALTWIVQGKVQSLTL
jgi:hypothetical protein